MKKTIVYRLWAIVCARTCFRCKCFKFKCLKRKRFKCKKVFQMHSSDEATRL